MMGRASAGLFCKPAPGLQMAPTILLLPAYAPEFLSCWPTSTLSFAHGCQCIWNLSPLLTESLKWVVYIPQLPLVTSNSHSVTCWLSYSLLLTFRSPVNNSVHSPCPCVYVPCSFLVSGSFFPLPQASSGFTYHLPNVGMPPCFLWLFLRWLLCPGR